MLTRLDGLKYLATSLVTMEPESFLWQFLTSHHLHGP